jgi:hypothetical protein
VPLGGRVYVGALLPLLFVPEGELVMVLPPDDAVRSELRPLVTPGMSLPAPPGLL